MNKTSISNKQVTKYFLNLDKGEAEAIGLDSELKAEIGFIPGFGSRFI